MNGNGPTGRSTAWVRLPASFIFCLVAAFSLQQGEYDLLLKGGYLIDPKNGISGHRDVAISQGKIAAVAESIDQSKATQTLDVNGLYITPGLVDLHVHIFSTTNIPGAWAGDNSVQPDSNTLPTGVTTAVDAGSSGWRNFEFFRHTVIDKERLKTRVLAHINIAGFGMITDITEQKDFNPEEVARMAKKHSDVIVGVKSAHYRQPDWESVDQAVKAGTLWRCDGPSGSPTSRPPRIWSRRLRAGCARDSRLSWPPCPAWRGIRNAARTAAGCRCAIRHRRRTRWRDGSHRPCVPGD